MNILKLGVALMLTLQLSACNKTPEKQNVHDKINSTQEQSILETQAVKTTVDWTPVFVSWENGCRDTPIFWALQDGLYNYPGAEPDPNLPQAGRIVLPEQYKKAVSPEITVTRATESSEFSVTVNEGTYHGMKLSKIVVYGGHGNGINGRYIELKPTDAELRQFFKNVKFEKDYENADEYMDFMAQIDVQDDKVVISCNASM